MGFGVFVAAKPLTPLGDLTMKTILLEIEDKTYQTVLDFIKLLPENRCRIIEDDNLSEGEYQPIQAYQTQMGVTNHD